MVWKVLSDNVPLILLLWLITRIPKWFLSVVLPGFVIVLERGQVHRDTDSGIPEANLSQPCFVIYSDLDTTIRRKHGVFKILLGALRKTSGNFIFFKFCFYIMLKSSKKNYFL